ncbi:MAG: phytoene desaturase [Bacteroidales bacterium]|nr:phytoene desaturase [Bacteroidales bacterium]
MSLNHISTNIIGSGIGGMAAAIRLAKLGHAVRVFEKNPGPGGKLNSIDRGGFRFDTGPSLLTLPALIEEILADAPEDIKSLFKVRKLDNICRYYFADGATLNAPSDPGEFSEVFSGLTGENKKNIDNYLRKVHKLYDLTAPVFIFGNFHRKEELFQAANIKVLLNLYRLNPFATMHGYNKRRFRSPKLVQLFDRYATYNGSSPYKAPATLNVIAHLEHNTGAFFPENGMFSISLALYEYARHLGVKFIFDTYVNKIIIEGEKVKGVLARGSEYKSDIVVSDCDVFHLYENLMPGIKAPAGSRKKNLSSSAIIYYWGLGADHPGLDLHNIFFAADYREEFNCLFRKYTMHDDPTVYVFISSKMVRQDAPEGKSNWFVMVNAPNDRGQDWDKLVLETRTNILGKLEKMLGMNIHEKIEEEFIISPPELEKNTLSTGGALYGNSSNSATSAFYRHANFSKKIRGLYFTGGSVHPGGGIPLCLASAAIVEREILREYHNT